MTTLLYTHPSSLAHETPAGHPERPDRIRAIAQVLSDPGFDDLVRLEAPLASEDDLLLAHAEDYVEFIRQLAPDDGYEFVDADTAMSGGTLEAALRAVGAACAAVDAVALGDADNAFCAMRPPGHHAESRRAMGFCFFNQAAIAALRARVQHGADRVAVVDFDVHHGNGTQEIFWPHADLFYGSTHQMPLFPGTGSRQETGVGNIFNAPLRAGDGSEAFREAMGSVILPALGTFAPDLVVISAGFDAHHRDPLGSLRLTEADFAWATLRIMEVAATYANGRVVSVLEGGYDLKALAGSTASHVHALMYGSAEMPGLAGNGEIEDEF